MGGYDQEMCVKFPNYYFVFYPEKDPMLYLSCN